MKQSFDQEIRDALQQEPISVPASAHERTEQLLDALPEKESKPKLFVLSRAVVRVSQAAACILFVLLVLLPNVSVAYAKAVENIPVIGSLVEIFTIRNYFYSDDRHELDVQVPQVSDPGNQNASDLINKDVNQLTAAVIQQFYADMEITHDKGYGSIYIDYETVMNTDKWFTLKLTVTELAASSNTYFRFYHIDRTTGTYVTFGDLFDEADYPALEQLIIRQMRQEMDENEDAVYWIDGAEAGESFTALSGTQNFYFDDAGSLVIVYNKYEVGPGSMGCPEIKIPSQDFQAYLDDFHTPE